jgi:hypothetical protein
MVTNGKSCGVPSYTTSADVLKLDFPDGECSSLDSGTETSLRINEALTRIEFQRTIHYSITADHLTLRAHGYRITFVRTH